MSPSRATTCSTARTFTRCCSASWARDETVLLSTHLLEEVSGFIGRAVLLHQGRIKGDVSMSELEEQGVSLMDYVKSAWNYRADRIRSAIEELSGEDGQT